MKILHAAFMVNPLAGVRNQMSWETLAAKELGLNWDTRLFCCHPAPPESGLIVQAKLGSIPVDGKSTTFVSRTKLHIDYLRWLRSVEKDYDAILLRDNASDPFQAGFVRTNKCPVFTVHHTLEVPELNNSYSGYSRIAHVGLEKLTEKFTLSATHGTIAVTGEILRYEGARNRHTAGKPGYIYPNGIYYENDSGGGPQDTRGEIPELLFIASHFAPWHGLDRLLESLPGSDAPFILHLVGRLSAADKAAAAADSRIKLHGWLDSISIQTLSRKCWLGLSSFALDRNGMQQACTLKVREYLYHGLPVYANYKDVFPEEFRYYRTGNPDIRDILHYGWSVRDATRSEVSEAARPFISKSALLQALHDWLQLHIQN
jgi:glycosyltransferase involved in cell wall biosynthesis